jgi:hypothetical protein
MRRLIVFGTALLALIAARDAAAQGFISPFVGTTLTSPTSTGSATKPGFGVSLGSLGGFLGGETEIAYYPEVIDNSANGLSKNKVLSFSGGLLLGPKIGGVKPYVALGAGDLHLNVTKLASLAQPTPASISNDYFTFNVGGGVAALISSHFGVRGDLRYFRAFGIKVEDLQGAGLALDHFNFWRAAGGVVIAF